VGGTNFETQKVSHIVKKSFRQKSLDFFAKIFPKLVSKLFIKKSF
jgi:hypothetical protein